MTATVIAIGQRFAGDDAVGPIVGDRLRGAPGVDVIEARDAADLVEALGAGGPVIVVDALRAPGAPPGEVRVLAPEDLGPDVAASISSHGLDVAGAIALAGALYGSAAASRARLVGVVAARTDRFEAGLSPAVATAVDRAVEVVLELVRELVLCPSAGHEMGFPGRV